MSNLAEKRTALINYGVAWEKDPSFPCVYYVWALNEKRKVIKKVR